MNNPDMPSTSPVDLSILIVSWNVSAFLRACLQSVARECASHPALNFEVIVVDSASTDDTLAMLDEEFRWVRVRPQTENVGFTRGNNIGLAAARGRYLLLLNPDTEVREGALAAMLAHLEAHPEVGIVGPHTLNSDGTHQSSRRRFPTRMTAIFEATWLQPYAPRKTLDRYYARDVADEAVGDVDWVQGSALMARRAVYDQIGGLDEGFVMYFEELDWCKRARNAGWKVHYLGAAYIVHHGGKSTEQAKARRQIHFQQSKIRYFRKHFGLFTAIWVRLFLIALYIWQMGLEALKGLLLRHPRMRLGRVRDYWQVIGSLAGLSKLR